MDAIVTAGGHLYAVRYDRVPKRHCVVTGALTDDADGRSLARDARISVDEPLLRVEFSDEGYGLAGDPDVALADASIPHPLVLVVTAPGYRDGLFNVTVPALPTGPVVRHLALRRLPFEAGGQVLGLVPGPAYAPVAGAFIDLIGPAGPGGELPLLLAQPLRRDPGPAATLRQRSLAAQPLRIAAVPAVAGDGQLVLADGGGVAAGQLLRFGPPERRHWAEVAEVLPDPDRPAPAALVRLVEPLAGSVAAGDTVAPFAPGAFTGPTAIPSGVAFAGEGVLWVDVLPTGGDVLALREAGLPHQYHDVGVTSGLDGDYALHGLARLGSCDVTVAAAGYTFQMRNVPAARLAAAPLDWRLAP
jgi:hypothetical protein